MAKSKIQAMVDTMAKDEKLSRQIAEIIEKNYGETYSFIKEATSPVFKEYFSPEDFLLFFQSRSISETKRRLEILQKKMTITLVLQKMEMSGLIANFFALFDFSNSLEKDLKNFFKDTPFEEDALKMLQVVQAEINLKNKIAKKERERALNKKAVSEKKLLLQRALKHASWGSAISFHIVKDFVLLLGGEKRGK